MSVEQQRAVIGSCYKSYSWKNKVARMPANQVIAIYLSFKQRGLIR